MIPIHKKEKDPGAVKFCSYSISMDYGENVRLYSHSIHLYSNRIYLYSYSVRLCISAQL